MDDIVRDFLSEANESIEALDRALVRFEREPEDPDLLSEIFRVMHTIKGTCGFLGLPRLAAVAHAGENILGEFRAGALRPTQDSVSAILECVDVIKALLAHLEASGAEPPGNDSGIINRLNAIASAGPSETQTSQAQSASSTPPAQAEPLSTRIGDLSTVDCAIEMALAAARAKPEGIRLHALQEETLHAAVRDTAWARICGEAAPGLDATLNQLGLNGGEEPALILAAIETALGDLGVEPTAIVEALSCLRDAPAPTAAPTGDASVQAPASASAVAAQTIRVQVQSLEQLMNVASELVLIRNQLLQTLRTQPESPFAGPLQRLNHVTTELQESVMTTRMQPIGAAWAKLPRLARDLAVELGKRIDIEMSGDETELDRQVLEQIKDPLTHMIRNAADHGLETPGERARAGKPEAGRIRLAARHEGSHIVIEVSDDGKGLAIAKIRAKALAQNLISPAEAETMSDGKIQQLIFHPGFSTATAVTGVSGRGVGMDVVRTNIEKIGGTVELASVEGKGTAFTIRIPLTLTIVSALIVDCCGERFALPQSSVVELVGLGGGRTIETVNGAPVLRLRDRLLPLVSLQELMHLVPKTGDDERSIIVTRVGSFTFGVIVDHVFDTEEIVVKPAASVFRPIPFYSGATILGDGAVIMILDPKGIAARIGSAAIGERDEDASAAHVAETMTQILIVRGAGPALKATPLQLVSRIETVASESIEYANGRPVLQYRGRLMPLVALDPATDIAEAGRQRLVLVFDDGARAIGLVVEEIVDIAESPLRQEYKARAPGALGSLVVGQHVTDVIDLAYYWRETAFDTAPNAASSGARKRALIIDPSQFQRNLVAPLLTLAGFDVAMADDSAGACALIERGQNFDVILTDAWISDRDLELTTHAPMIGLTDVADISTTGFAGAASRFDRDGILTAIDNALRPIRTAA